MYAFNWALTAFRSESYIGSATALPDTVIHTVTIVTRGAITSIQHSKSYTCTVLHGPEATMRYYGAEPAPTVASHAQQLKFLLSSAFAEETVLLVGSKFTVTERRTRVHTVTLARDIFCSLRGATVLLATPTS